MLIFLIVCCLLCSDVLSLAAAAEVDYFDASSLPPVWKCLLSSVWFVLVAVVDLDLLLSGNIRSNKPQTLHVKH